MVDSLNPACYFCSKAIGSEPAFRHVTGWVEPRKQGGANQIVLRQDTGEVAHKRCVWLRQHGITDGQESMFG